MVQLSAELMPLPHSQSPLFLFAKENPVAKVVITNEF